MVPALRSQRLLADDPLAHLPGPIPWRGGWLGGVAFDEVDEHTVVDLPEACRRYATPLPDRRRSEWFAGRLALRGALLAAGATDPGPLDVDGFGRPAVPRGFVGSITHKAGLALAFAGVDSGWTIGLDSEDLSDRPRPSIAPRILRPEELDHWNNNGARWDELLAAFSVKESLYKAVHPWVPRYIGFHEARVLGAEPEMVLAGGESTVTVRCGWERWGERLISYAMAQPADPGRAT